LTAHPVILIVIIYCMLLISRRWVKMPNRENLRIVMEFVGLWLVVVGIVFAIPNFYLYGQVLTVSIVAVAVILFAVYYFKQKADADFYSPIHAMIVRANNKVPRELALQSIIGILLTVKELGIDYRKISETFNQNSTKLKDEDLKKWTEIEEQITRYINGGGFWLGRDTQEWFDDLENRYNH
jgi:hypothetical protein